MCIRDRADDRVLVVRVADRLAAEGELAAGELRELDSGQVHERDDRQQHGDRDGAHQKQRGRRVLALGLLERRDAVGDGLHAGQGGTSGGEGTQEKEDHGKAGESLRAMFWNELELRTLGRVQGSGGRLVETEQRHTDDADDECVGGTVSYTHLTLPTI